MQGLWSIHNKMHRRSLTDSRKARGDGYVHQIRIFEYQMIAVEAKFIGHKVERTINQT